MSSARSSNPACVSCRQRKIRCDGKSPCGSCSGATTFDVCTYTPKSVGQLRWELPRRGACILCRQRKRRCDGKRPCQRCRDDTAPHECQYPDKPRNGKYTPAKQKPEELIREATEEVPDLSIPVPASYALADTARYDHDFPSAESLSPSKLPGLMGLWDYSLTLVNGRSSASDIITLPSSSELGHPIPGHPSSPVFPLNSAPCRTAELVTLRNSFLDHSWNYGLDITAEKHDALSRGDTSGLVVHPLLVNVCQLLGYFIANHLPSGRWLYLEGQTEGEAAQASLIFDTLRGDILDPLTTMQVYTPLALYYALKGDVATFAQLFDQLGNIVLRNLTGLGLDNRETRSAFSGMMWIELGRILVTKVPPMLDPSIWAEFRQLTATYQAGTEINFLRAKSALVLYDTRQLVAEWPRLESAHSDSTLWSMRYSNLIEDIYTHLNVISKPVLRESFFHEAQVLIHKSCILVTLGALVELYAVFAPSQPESRSKHSEVIEKIAAITGTFSSRDFQYLDATLSVCWSIALRPVCDARSPEWDDSSPLPSHLGTRAARDIIREAHQRLSQTTPCVFE
ncbi:hypothetical protein DFH09DRAFT_1153547 [Mycena vulgaris]|nr:hypothetical protein DFH09DRAFT_1153547 [Mycena vulgaris]